MAIKTTQPKSLADAPRVPLTRLGTHPVKMPRAPGLRCACGALPMSAAHHGIAHGHPADPRTGKPHPSGPQRIHTIYECDPDPVALSHKREHDLKLQLGRKPTWEEMNPGERRFRITVQRPRMVTK